MDALNFECRKVALKQDKTGFILTLSIHPDEIPFEIVKDFVGSRYGCALVRINDDESPVAYTNRVQKAGMLCRNKDFMKFMGHETEAATATAVCLLCGIESRSELNGNKKAQQEFDRIVAEFEAENVPF